MINDSQFVKAGPNGTLEILPLVRQVRRAIGFIGKDQTNSHFNYQFRGIDDALNIVSPILVELGVTPVPIFGEHSHDIVNATQRGKPVSLTVAKVRCDLYLYADDGSYVMYRAYGEGKDTEGNATMFAESEAFKVAVFLGLMVPVAPVDVDPNYRQPVGEMDDGERASSQMKQEDEGKNRSVKFNNVKNKFLEAHAQGDVDAVKRMVPMIDKTASFSTEEKNALHTFAMKILNDLSGKQTQPNK